MAYITVLLIVAEPCRNAGKYTFGDILSFHTDPKPVRVVADISTVTVSSFYLTTQMVGAGKLMALLAYAIASIGLVMVSPNMTDPKVVAAGVQKIITAMEKKQAELIPGASLDENDQKGLEMLCRV